jgi:tetratricopeptide (TPR) repeat protein
MAYYSAAAYLGRSQGADAFKKEMDELAILALKFENVASVRSGFDLGYRTDRYESVVAGKGAWVLHMLRQLLGDDRFQDLIREYMKDARGGRGSTPLFQSAAEKQFGKPLGWYFAEWVDTTGIPSLQTDYTVYKTLEGFRVMGTVTQERDLFQMPLEVALVGTDEESLKDIELNGKSTAFDIESFSKPAKIVLDPNGKLLQNSPALQTSVQLALGQDRREQGDYVGAIRAYESALKLSPQKSLAHYNMAEVYYEQFNLQSAADSFRNALNGDLDPKWIEVWSYIYLGKIYDILGQRQRALAEYTKAINTKDDTRGAQAEAKKWTETPFTRKRTLLGD